MQSKEDWNNHYNEFAPLPIEEEDENEEFARLHLGNFSGSTNKLLMTCDRSGSKLSWEDPNKLYSWGQTSIKHVYEKAMERRTGIFGDFADSWQMRHGKENEPYVIDSMMKRQEFSDYEKCDFILSEDVSNLGATPDGVVLYKGKRVAVEIKSTVNWGGFHDRIAVDFNEKHQDFWQWMTEMHVLGVDGLVFIVAYPMQAEEFEVVEVKFSRPHMGALKQRIIIANHAIEKFNFEKGRDMSKYIEQACFDLSEK